MNGLVRQDVVLPILPDVYHVYTGCPDHEALPHPDGHPWLKSCSECACVAGGAMALSAEERRQLLAGCHFEGSDPARSHFYCLHRTDDGFNRVCACYGAAWSAP